MQRHTIFFLPLFDHVHLLYGVPQCPQISRSVKAYFPEYLPDWVFVPTSLTLRLLVLRAISSCTLSKISFDTIAG